MLKIARNAEACRGCRTCQLICSFHHRGVFSLERSDIRSIAWSPTEYENVPEVVFWQTQAQEIENIAGICVFLGTRSGTHAIEPSDYVHLISPAWWSSGQAGFRAGSATFRGNREQVRRIPVFGGRW